MHTVDRMIQRIDEGSDPPTYEELFNLLLSEVSWLIDENEEHRRKIEDLEHEVYTLKNEE